MIETIVVLLGLCITFLPVLIYFKYLMTHVSKKSKFDYHLELVRDKKGNLGVGIAYLERILWGAFVCTLGILMSEFFANEIVLKSFILLVIVYIIIKYFDERNEK